MLAAASLWPCSAHCKSLCSVPFFSHFRPLLQVACLFSLVQCRSSCGCLLVQRFSGVLVWNWSFSLFSDLMIYSNIGLPQGQIQDFSGGGGGADKNRVTSWKNFQLNVAQCLFFIQNFWVFWQVYGCVIEPVYFALASNILIWSDPKAYFFLGQWRQGGEMRLFDLPLDLPLCLVFLLSTWHAPSFPANGEQLHHSSTPCLHHCCSSCRKSPRRISRTSSLLTCSRTLHFLLKRKVPQ